MRFIGRFGQVLSSARETISRNVVAQVGLGGHANNGLASRAAVGLGQGGPAVHGAREAAGDVRVNDIQVRAACRPRGT
jgi:hypothetical protein